MVIRTEECNFSSFVQNWGLFLWSNLSSKSHTLVRIMLPLVTEITTQQIFIRIFYVLGSS